MRFGFMKGKGTYDAIFIVREMQEKFRAKGTELYFGFVDLGNAFDSVPREVVWLSDWRSKVHCKWFAYDPADATAAELSS